MDLATHRGTHWNWIADDGKHGLGSGFGLRIYSSGAKSYVLRYRARDRLRFYTIGRATVLTLEEARERARALLVRIGDGEDPAEDRRRSRFAKSADAPPDRLSEPAKGDDTPDGLRAAADALMRRAEQLAREQEATRFAAIDLLKRADELENAP